MSKNQQKTNQYTPLALANFFIKNYGEDNGGIEHMKLQKLVYCAHGWWLASKSSPVINEKPQVWQYGPVFESLYHILKPYSRTPIAEAKSSSPFNKPDFVKRDDDEVKKLLIWVWNRYGHLTAMNLSDMTHKKGTPWYKMAIDSDFNPPRGLEISDDDIRQEFLAISARDNKKTA